MRTCIAAAVLVIVCSVVAGQVPGDAALEQAIRDLGADDYATREKASATLWAAGARAEPFLRRAVKSADAEVVARAKDLLDKIPFGITPNSPRQYASLVARARAASPTVWPDIVKEMLEDGAAGLDLARTIADGQTGPKRIAEFRRGIDKEAWRVAGRLIARNDLKQAEDILLRSAAWHAAAEKGDNNVIRHYVAMATIRGELDRHIQEWERRATGPAGFEGFLDDGNPGGAGAPAILALLCQSKGDFVKARQYADRSGRDAIIESVRFAGGDWGAVAGVPPVDQTGQLLLIAGLRMIATRLAGLPEADKARADFEATAEKEGESHYEAWLAFRAVLFDRRPADALALAGKIASPQSSIAAAEITAQLGQPDEGLKKLQEMPLPPNAKLMQQMAQARILHQIGRKDALARHLESMKRDRYEARDETGVSEHSLGGEFVESLVRWGRDGDAMDHAAALLTGGASEVFPKMFPRATAGAEAWYAFLRATRPADSIRQTLERIPPLLDHRLAEPANRKTLDEAVAWAREKPKEEASKMIVGLADAAAQAGMTDVAKTLLSKEDSPAALILLGDIAVESGKWDDSVSAYERAFNADEKNITALALLAWAKGRAGDKAEAEKLRLAAKLIPLGDEAARTKLYEDLAKRAATHEGLAGEVRYHRQLVIDLSLPGSSLARNALSRQLNDSAAWPNSDRAAAATINFLVRMIRTNSYFLGNDSYLLAIYRTYLRQSLACLARDDVPGAMKAAEAAFAVLPSTGGLAVELVPALDRMGRKAEADAFYAKVAKAQDQLISQYPESYLYKDQRAWLAIRCRRDLPLALELARQSMTIAPQIPAVRELYCEAQFQNGKKDDAAAVLREMLVRQPRNAGWKNLLKRVEAGDPKSPLPDR
ncbi:MAG: hypothetical protein K1X57_15585 [Gemmataceae bacterium]|nr:hypothetical protein [Gemmataceae bacterium]